MPGLHFVCDWRGTVRGKESHILGSLDALLHDDRYQRAILLRDDFYLLARTGYPGYPVERFELDGVLIFVEGRLYGVGRAALVRKLESLAALVFNPRSDRKNQIREWLLDSAGDFVLFLFHRASGRVAVLNDLFGRLPCYYSHSGGELLISRELRFIARRRERVRFDRMALAQFLLFGYPLGERTLLEAVPRLPPSTLISLDPGLAEVRVEPLHQFNFEVRAGAGAGVEANAARLVELFAAACESQRNPAGENVVSLSGGFDSRAVAACLAERGIPFRCATFLDHAGNAAPDVPIARRLAAALGVEWELSELDPPSPRETLRLLRMKNGMNVLSMAFLLPFLEKIRGGTPAEIYFITGEMGTFTLPPIRPFLQVNSLAHLAAYLIPQHQKFSPESVSALTGLGRDDILAEVENHVAGYPEQDPMQKYAHFIMYERAFKWHSEAEDRNRSYFWSVSPFYDTAFFNTAMGCLDEQKSNYDLYREFLRQLSPAIADIEHAGMGVAITAENFQTTARVVALLGAHPEARRRLKSRLPSPPSYAPDSLVVQCLRQQLANGDVLADYFSLAELRTLLDHYADYTVEQLDHLFTLTSIIQDLKTGTCVLERYG